MERIDLYANGIGGAKIGEYLSYLKIVFWVSTIIGSIFVMMIVMLSIRQLSILLFIDPASNNILISTLSFGILATTLGFLVLYALAIYYLTEYFRPINTYVYQKSLEPGLKAGK